jgi:hypothetical protein
MLTTRHTLLRLYNETVQVAEVLCGCWVAAPSVINMIDKLSISCSHHV